MLSDTANAGDTIASATKQALENAVGPLTEASSKLAGALANSPITAALASDPLGVAGDLAKVVDEFGPEVAAWKPAAVLVDGALDTIGTAQVLTPELPPTSYPPSPSPVQITPGISEQFVASMTEGATNATAPGGAITDHQYYSRDGGQTWYLRPWHRIESAGGLAGVLAAAVTALVMTLAALLVVATRACSTLSGGGHPSSTPLPPATVDSSTAVVVQGNPLRGGDSGASSTQSASDDPFWEAALQRQRMNARNSDEYNALVQEHLKIYQQRGVDPCDSGWFPGGCGATNDSARKGAP